uniref:Uncharacterized protein n=1 Tax=viral metagenome TaxID=1070528 RepID=A0A6C0KCZ0_9ZZZZ
MENQEHPETSENSVKPQTPPTSVEEDDYSDMPELVSDNEDTRKYAEICESINYIKDSFPSPIHNDNNNDTSDSEDETVECDENKDDDNEDECDEIEPVFVLSDEKSPIRYSDQFQTLSLFRDTLVKKETSKFVGSGKIYVSHNSDDITDTTSLSYMDRNLLWNTERLLKTFTIHRINKI